MIQHVKRLGKWAVYACLFTLVFILFGLISPYLQEPLETYEWVFGVWRIVFECAVLISLPWIIQKKTGQSLTKKDSAMLNKVRLYLAVVFVAYEVLVRVL